MQPYEARSFRFIELISLGPSRTGIIWRMKLYGIAWHRELPRPELIESAKAIAADQLATGCKPSSAGPGSGVSCATQLRPISKVISPSD